VEAHPPKKVALRQSKRRVNVVLTVQIKHGVGYR
jgi:hypothetical protein